MGRRLIFVLFLFVAVPAFSQDAVPVRTVTVRVIIDWDERPLAPEECVKQAIEFTNKEFLKNREKFGGIIRFTIASIDVWRNMWPDKVDLDVNIAHNVDVKSIAQHERNGADILFVYTPKMLLQEVSQEIDGDYQLGWRELLGYTGVPGESDSALITIGAWMDLTTLHEAYHLFGAVDREHDPVHGIMHNSHDGAEIDEENAVIVRKNLTREF